MDTDRVDAKIWKDRYPQIQVIAAADARTRVQQTVPVAATSVVGNDPDVSLLTVPGRRESEAALLVHGPNGSTFVLNDGVGNVHHLRLRWTIPAHDALCR